MAIQKGHVLIGSGLIKPIAIRVDPIDGPAGAWVEIDEATALNLSSVLVSAVGARRAHRRDREVIEDDLRAGRISLAQYREMTAFLDKLERDF